MENCNKTEDFLWREALVFCSEPHQSREFPGHFICHKAESDFSEAPLSLMGSNHNGWAVESPPNTASDIPPLEMLYSRLHIWLEVTVPRLIHDHRLERIRAAEGMENELCPFCPVTIWCGSLQTFYLFSEETIHWIPTLKKSIFICINLFYNFKWQYLPFIVIKQQGKWGCSDKS